MSVMISGRVHLDVAVEIKAMRAAVLAVDLALKKIFLNFRQGQLLEELADALFSASRIGSPG